MKKILLITLLFFLSPVYAEELQGGVTYDVNSARAYVQDGQISDIGQQSNLYYSNNGSTDDIIYGYSANNVPECFTVRYNDDLTRDYIYGMNNKLLYVIKNDRPTTEFPHRGYRYNTKGKLINTTLMTSKNNGFTFSPSGKLLGRLIGGVGYLGNTNIVIGSQSN